MSWRELFFEVGNLRVGWLIAGIALLSLLIAGLGAWLRLREPCVDTVPAYDGRCWGERDLVVEQGAVVCRCRRAP